MKIKIMDIIGRLGMPPILSISLVVLIMFSGCISILSWIFIGDWDSQLNPVFRATDKIENMMDSYGGEYLCVMLTVLYTFSLLLIFIIYRTYQLFVK